MDEMDYGLKEMNEIDYGLKKINNVTKAEVMWGWMMIKSITEKREY